MAKNISKNQWFKDIIDNVYIHTAVINDMLIISVSSTTQIAGNNILAKARDTKLFEFNGKSISCIDNLILNQRGELKNISMLDKYVLFMIAPLKTKQLETDLYSTEQLAEMYPNDPAYQVAAPDIMYSDIPDNEKSEPTIEPPVSITEPTIMSEVNNHDEPS